jgi:hypothetical protein
MLIVGTQLGKYRGKKGEDRVCNFFLLATYKILNQQTSLGKPEIKDIQKHLYTHFLIDDGARESWPCHYAVKPDGYNVYWPKYSDGKLVEVKSQVEWSPNESTKKLHPGRQFLRKRESRVTPSNDYTCPYRNQEQPAISIDATHCSNGHQCKYVSNKIENWYKNARKRKLLM